MQVMPIPANTPEKKLDMFPDKNLLNNIHNTTDNKPIFNTLDFIFYIFFYFAKLLFYFTFLYLRGG
jgi:hypothetical protein